MAKKHHNQNVKCNVKITPISVIDLERRGSERRIKLSKVKAYSAFPHEIATMSAEMFCRDSKLIVDPFGGWGERGYAVKNEGKQYVGFDLSDDAIDHAKEQYDVELTKGDSRVVDVPVHDGLITCPPYWNLERYNNVNGLDHCRDWENFLIEYEHILSRFAEKAQKGATYCIATGDWRKGGRYHDLTFETQRIMKALGFVIFDVVIMNRKKNTPVGRMLPNSYRMGYTAKVHETLTVFRKVWSGISIVIGLTAHYGM